MIYYVNKLKKSAWTDSLSGCGSVWLERCVRDAEAGGSNPLTPTIFFAKKMVNEAVRLRSMHRRCASWHNVPLHTAKPCFIKAWRWSIVSLKLHNMKHLHFVPIWWENKKWELCLQIFLVYAILFGGKENSHGKIFKQTRWSLCCLCLYYMAKPYILQQIQSVTPTVAMRMFTVETHGIFLNICPNW